MAGLKTKRICKVGHVYYKSSDCPTCPVCEKLKEPATGFLALFSSPARNALLHQGIDSVQKLSTYSEKEILKLHGIGKASLPRSEEHTSELQSRPHLVCRLLLE